MRIALGPSGGILGEVSSHDGTTIVDARTETHLTVDTFHWPLDDGPLSISGPLALEELAVALTFASGSAPVGRATTPRARGGHLEILVPGLDGPVSASHVELRELRVTLEEDVTRLVAGTLSIGRLSMTSSEGDVRIDQVVATGVEVVSRKGQPVEVRLGAVEVDGVKVELTAGYVAVHGGLLTGIELSSDVTVRRARADAAHVVVREREPSPPAPPGRRPSPIDLAFLDGLEGHIRADVSTHVRLPLVPDWRALHRIRLDVREGRIEFERLEHGLSKLPDAILDFKLRDGRLCLDKDIPVVPFDRTTLLSWPLSDEELRHAHDGWVQLSRLLEPKVEIQRRRRARDDGGRFLQEVRVQDIDVSLSLDFDDMLDLPSGARLRLGAAVDSTVADDEQPRPAIESATMRGEVVYRPDERRPSGTVILETARLALGIDGLPVGQRALNVPRLSVARTRSEVRTKDLFVESVYTDLEDVELESLVIAA